MSILDGIKTLDEAKSYLVHFHNDFADWFFVYKGVAYYHPGDLGIDGDTCDNKTGYSRSCKACWTAALTAHYAAQAAPQWREPGGAG